ncbi:MAG: phosphate ABC transporter ATP-binding protein, partial [Phyllobacteriaceae bacterium]|nr:phosphate ABC transporter ATP-binding protein [Phyllobacteriaceae bacterium]
MNALNALRPDLAQKITIKDLKFFYGTSLALKTINLPL